MENCDNYSVSCLNSSYALARMLNRPVVGTRLCTLLQAGTLLVVKLGGCIASWFLKCKTMYHCVQKNQLWQYWDVAACPLVLAEYKTKRCFSSTVREVTVHVQGVPET